MSDLRPFAIVFCTVFPATVWRCGNVHGEGLEDMPSADSPREPVEILVDRWGVAHIYARNEEDLFFAQGYQAARDRLFQLELWRRQATGTVSEVLGRRELERDIGARLLKFRGDLRQELNHYHPRGEAIVTSFVRGINAWIERTRQDPSLLPLEFRVLGIEPGEWTPQVVISRHQGLLQNVTQELSLGRAVSVLGPEQVRDLVWLHPGKPDLTLDPSIDAKLLSADILKRYREARAPIKFLPEDVLPEYRAPQTVLIPSDRSSGVNWQDIGSNNWVVSGRLTQSGAAVMANDPHRTLAVPSLRYFVHLVAPGWNVIGGGEPALPGVSIGHNEHGAWGLTIFHIDSEDLYVYETRPDDPLQFRYGDRWERMRVVQETIPVKGESPVVVDLKFTPHGPVLYEDPERHVACALRAAWLEVGCAPYLASLRIDTARTVEEFRDACRYSHVPGENMVWAGRDGHIGWQVVGIAPRRPNWHGLVPVPGDGRHEWDGYLPVLDLPHVVDPEQGFWNTSNEALVPADYPHRECLGWSWADPFRGARVREVLASGRKLTLTDMMQLQQDEMSLPARALVPLLRDLTPESEPAREALRRLRDWDFVLDRDSPSAGIYAMWERRLHDNVRTLLVPEAARPHIEKLSLKRIIDWLLLPDGRFGADPLAGRDALLLQSLAEAVQELERRFGPQVDDWRYGQPGYKHALFHHPLSTAVNEEVRARLDVGPFPRGGSSYTVNNTGGEDNQPSGGSFRVIIDTGDWDQAVATNTPGQSGVPGDSHYRDLAGLWATGRYFPLYYSREKIETVREQTLRLEAGE